MLQGYTDTGIASWSCIDDKAHSALWTLNLHPEHPAPQGYTDAGIASWSGNDDEAHAARHDHGAAGVISVTSNVVPGLFSGLMRARDDAQNEALQVGQGF